MRFDKLRWILTLLPVLIGCNNPGDSSQQPSPNQPLNGATLPALSGPNILPLSVNGSLCSEHSYFNKPCVSVKVCAPGNPNHCQVIQDILVDTGSYGFRVFNSVLEPEIASALTPVLESGKQLAQCARFGDGSADWGPIKTADLVLGEEPAVSVPIQLIDSTFSDASTYCRGAEASPIHAGLNGILGVGVFSHDCGARCVTQRQNNLYYACEDSQCAKSIAQLQNQVRNPISLLPVDNNGIIIELPSVPLGGRESATGYLVLGIGTQTNNIPKKVKSISLDPNTGEFFTDLNGKLYTSFLDTGSNGLFFPQPTTNQIPDCGTLSTSLSNWFCPNSVVSLSASLTSHSGDLGSTIPFQIGNMANLKETSHFVFSEVGGNIGANSFDWGLPFYLGRNVYVGIERTSSTLGTGPYVAF